MKNAPKSIFRNAMDAMVDARERQARAYLNSTLMMLDDTTLARYGIERKTLNK